MEGATQSCEVFTGQSVMAAMMVAVYTQLLTGGQPTGTEAINVAGEESPTGHAGQSTPSIPHGQPIR